MVYFKLLFSIKILNVKDYLFNFAINKPHFILYERPAPIVIGMIGLSSMITPQLSFNGRERFSVSLKACPKLRKVAGLV